MALSSSLKNSGSTNRWRKIRQQIIKRDGVCQSCGTDQNLTVDHIIPRRLMEHGSDSPSNLQTLCGSCNSRKGGRFFESTRTPPTLPVSFYPETESKIHDQD